MQLLTNRVTGSVLTFSSENIFLTNFPKTASCQVSAALKNLYGTSRSQGTQGGGLGSHIKQVADNYWLNLKTSYPCQGPDLASHFSISVLMYLSIRYALFEILGIARVDKQ